MRTCEPDDGGVERHATTCQGATSSFSLPTSLSTSAPRSCTVSGDLLGGTASPLARKRSRLAFDDCNSGHAQGLAGRARTPRAFNLSGKVEYGSESAPGKAGNQFGGLIFPEGPELVADGLAGRNDTGRSRSRSCFNVFKRGLEHLLEVSVAHPVPPDARVQLRVVSRSGSKPRTGPDSGPRSIMMPSVPVGGNDSSGSTIPDCRLVTGRRSLDSLEAIRDLRQCGHATVEHHQGRDPQYDPDDPHDREQEHAGHIW